MIPPLWTHQKEALAFAMTRPATMLALDMGTGKTRVALEWILRQNLTKTLVLCPKSVVPVWKKQAELFAPTLNVNALQGTIADRVENLRGDVIITNYEGAWRDPLAAKLKQMAASGEIRGMILDESHRIKDPGGKQSWFAKDMGKHVARKLCLTGTPLPHSPLDIYGQFRFLNPFIFGFYYTKFRQRYAKMGGYQGKQVLGFQNIPELEGKMNAITFRVTAEQVLDLPDFTHTEIPVTLSEATLRHYLSMKNEFITWVSSQPDIAVVASIALVKLLRLQQIASGFATDEEGVERIFGNEKADALADLLEGLAENEPVVVFCKFKRDLRAVQETCLSLNRTCAELSGDKNELAIWQAGERNVLAAQIQSGKEGIDLTRSRYAVYYSHTFSLGDYEQSLRRIRRPGQGRTCHYYHLVATGTVDEDIREAVANKREIVESIISKMRSL